MAGHSAVAAGGLPFERRCRRTVGGTPGAGQRTLDAGNPLRQGVQVTAQLAQLRDYGRARSGSAAPALPAGPHRHQLWQNASALTGITILDWRNGVKPELARATDGNCGLTASARAPIIFPL